MIEPVDYPTGNETIVVIKPNKGEEDFYFFNHLNSDKELSHLEDFLLCNAHEVVLKYEEHFNNQVIEKPIENYEDYLEAIKFRTCQGTIIKAYTKIDEKKLSKEWTCKKCQAKNEKDQLNCRVCGNFISLTGKVKKIKRKLSN